MAGRTAPKIITNGLTLYLDAGNVRSYASGSTTWRDLTPNNNNGTLINGPTFSTEANGCITFDGVNDYVNTVSASSLLNFQTAGTIDIVFKILSAPVADYITIAGFHASSNRTIWIETAEVATDRVRLLWSLSSGTLGSIRSNINPSTNRNINHVVGTYEVSASNVIFKIYVNGSQFGSTSTVSGSLTNNTAAPFIIGSLQDLSNFANANVYSAKIYNRALSATEILQNYNATKTKFGLT